jgi:hypothetical protein
VAWALRFAVVLTQSFMTKNIFLALAAVAALASCKKDPTLDEQLAGTWNLSDLTLSGSLPTPVGTIPFTITDSLIRPNNTLILAINDDLSKTVNWNLDVRGLFSAAILGSFGVDIQDTIVGTWYSVDGGGVVADSLYFTADGESIGFEVLSLLENSLNMRSVQTIDDPDLGTQTVTQNVTFIK